MLPFPRQRHSRDFGGCGNSLPLLLPRAESARAPALLPTLLPGLPRGLSGSPDPLPVPAAVWEPARAPGSRDALRPLPVPRLPHRFPLTPREAPVGLQMGQTVPLVPVLPPALGGRWGWKAPPGRRGDAGASVLTSNKASRGRFVCYPETWERSSKADSNPLQRLAKKKERGGE